MKHNKEDKQDNKNQQPQQNQQPAEQIKQPKQEEIKTQVVEDEIKKLQEMLETLQKEKDELFARLQRLSADYANFQKRAVRQIDELTSYEKEKIIKSFLPVMDNFEQSIRKAQSTDDVQSLKKAIQMLYDQLVETLRLHNVEQIKSLGVVFNPSQHEAMLRKADTEKPDNIVLEEFQKGYKLNDTVIRPSRVIVNKLPAPQQAEDETTDVEDTPNETNEKPQEQKE
jgi:molecular chaperone GrpE